MTEPPFSFPRPKEEIEEELRAMIRSQRAQSRRPSSTGRETTSFESVVSSVVDVLCDLAVPDLTGAGQDGGGDCGGGDGGGGGD